MNHNLPRFLILGLLAGVSSSAMAQTDLSYLFTSRPKNYFSAGINIRSGGPSVKFSHLGTLPRSLFDPTQGANVYDDGAVGSDAKRPDETPSTGADVLYNSDKSRYQVIDKSTGLVYADELAYNAARTRIWSVDNASQVNGDQVDFHFVTAQETGARTDGTGGEGGKGNGPGKSSGGFDLQLARDIALIGKRASWGVAFSFGMNDINSKTSQAVNADVETYTASYKLYSALPPSTLTSTGVPFYSAPSPSTAANGGGGVEDTAPLSQTAILFNQGVDPTKPVSTADNPALLPGSKTGNVPTYGAATVTGTWKIKGAYYLMRLGPSFRYFVTRHVSLSGNFGVAGAYVGSDFTIDERLTAPVISTLQTQPTFFGKSHKREFKVGAFAEANAEYWMTFRTGLYAGVVYETLGHYRHELNDAVAQVDIGSGLSFRLGVITRF